MVFLRPRLCLDLRNSTRPHEPKKSHHDGTRNGEQISSKHSHGAWTSTRGISLVNQNKDEIHEGDSARTTLLVLVGL